MSRDDILKKLEDHGYDGDDGILLADGFEDAFVGVALKFNTPSACYDYDKCIKILEERDGMSEEDAAEHMSFNVEGAYVGDNTPVFLRRME